MAVSLVIMFVFVAATYEQLDWQMSEYIEFLWKANQLCGMAGDAIGTIIHFTNAKKRMPSSWRFSQRGQSKRFQCERLQ